MSKITPESCYGNVFSLMKFTVNKDEYKIIPKRDSEVADGWVVQIYKNDKQIVSKSVKTVGNMATNKAILTLKNEYAKREKTL